MFASNKGYADLVDELLRHDAQVNLRTIVSVQYCLLDPIIVIMVAAV